MVRPLQLGIAMWLAGTIAIRLAGQYLLQPSHTPRTVLLYSLSFVLMALVVRGICRSLKLAGDASFKAVAVLMLPTLILDPFSSAFFSSVFPNVDPAAAGVFGGWMLICCAGAVAGAFARPSGRQ
jgi:hypothetical protein